jgi:hypothetical protein
MGEGAIEVAAAFPAPTESAAQPLYRELLTAAWGDSWIGALR